METDKTQNKQNKFTSWFKSSSGIIWLFVAVLILVNLVAVRAFKRWDITGPRSYSLSAASREVVQTLETPLSVKVFFSKNLPAPYSSVYQYTQDILSEYQTSANRQFSYETFDMDKPENQTLARNYGLNQLQIREVKNNEVGFKNAYMGLVLTYADQIEVLDGITSSEGLEYRITTAISKVISASNALNGLTDPVTVTLYRSKKLGLANIANFDKLDSTVQKSFDAVNKKYNGQLTLQTVDPSSQEVKSLNSQYGLETLSLRNQDGSTEYVTVGLVVESGKQFKVVPLELANMIFTYGIAGLDELEDNLDLTIKGLVSKTTTVVYVTGHGEADLNDEKNGAANFASLFDGSYTLSPLNLDTDTIPAGVQTMIINGPRSEFKETELYKIDQFLMKGGNLMVFKDPFNEIQPQGQQMYYQQPQYIPLKTGLETILEKYGVKMENSYVFDEKGFVQNHPQYGKLTLYYAPTLQKDGLSKKSPITQNLGYVIFLQPGPIDSSAAKDNKDTNVTVLAKTSAKSWTQSSDIILNPMYMQPPADKTTEKSQDIAVLVEGIFNSAYDKAVEPEKTDDEATAAQASSENILSGDSHIQRSVQSGKIFVASTSYITSPALIQQESSEPIALFLQNAMDYLNGNADLCTMRTKGLSLNTLKKTKGADVNFIKYFCEAGLGILVILAGVLVLLLRRRRRIAIRMRYNPNDAREISVKKDKAK